MSHKGKMILFYILMMLAVPIGGKTVIPLLVEKGIIGSVTKTTEMLYINMAVYIILPVISFIVMRRELAKDTKKAGGLLSKVFPLILVVYASSILGGILIRFIDHDTTSANQAMLNTLQNDNFLFLVYMAVFAAPIVEECVFRCCIISDRQGFFGVLMLVISSSLFGLVHVQQFSIGAFFSYAIIGLALGIIYLKNRNLILNILVHSGYNALCLILSTVLRKYI